MSSARQHIKHVFCTNNCEEKCFGIAIDGGKKYVTTRLDQSSTSLDDSARVGNVFKHFHTGYNIKSARLFFCKSFCTNFPVIYSLCLRLKRMQLSNFQRLACKIYPNYYGTSTCH